MKDKKKYLVLMIVSVMAFILITIGVTYSFFSYIGSGATDNTIKAGSVSFIYEETNKMGNGIKIEDALPISDTEGKESSNYFDFKVTSSTGTTIAIPYEITARKTEGSNDLDEYVKLYLTKVNGTSEQDVALSIYDNLEDSQNRLAAMHNDKTLYKGEIPVGATDYTENYRLRMWLNNDSNDGKVLDYSPVYKCSNETYTTKEECETNNGVWNPTEEYNNQGQTFSIKINVYANGETATQEKVASATTTAISGIKVNNIEAVENTDDTLNYDYYVETTLEDANNIELVALNDGQTYTVENITEAEANTLRQVGTKKDLNLVKGENYLKVTVSSANKQNTQVYVVKVLIVTSKDNTLHSLSIENCPLNETFSSDVTNYTCTVPNGIFDVSINVTKHDNATISESLKDIPLMVGTNDISITVTPEDPTIAPKVYTITITVPEQPVPLVAAIKSVYAVNGLDNLPTTTTDAKNVDSNSGPGLYKTTPEQLSNGISYYFRGRVTNNYVNFAGFTWKIVRINEDGTIRLILANGISENGSKVNVKFQTANLGSAYYKYYTYKASPTDITAMTKVNAWYDTNIDKTITNVSTKKYADYLAEISGDKYYFCENYHASLIATLDCTVDENGYGPLKYNSSRDDINPNIGLITMSEAIMADAANNSYINDGQQYWTMTSNNDWANTLYYVRYSGFATNPPANIAIEVNPVINLKSDVTVTGSGTLAKPWTIVYE